MGEVEPQQERTQRREREGVGVGEVRQGEAAKENS